MFSKASPKLWACSPVSAMYSTMPTGPANSLAATFPWIKSPRLIQTVRVKFMVVSQVCCSFLPKVARSTPLPR